LAAVEKQMEVEFPESYRQFLLAFNGGRPNPAYFTVVEDGEVVWMRIHFFFGVDDAEEGCDLLWHYRTLKGRLPRDVVSIASDEGGNLFCLDLRKRGHARVLFWDHELERAGPRAALKIVIAESFEDWLAQLTARA
jgi:hypothetical protein